MATNIVPDTNESLAESEQRMEEDAVPPTDNEQNVKPAGINGGENEDDLAVVDDSDAQNIPVTSSEDSSVSLADGSKKASVGEKCSILPTDIANMRKREKSKCSSSKIGNFFTLCTGAQMLLPNTPVVRSDPNEIAKEVAEAEARAASKLEKTKSGEQEKKAKKVSEPPSFLCELCDVTSTSEQTHITHLQGKKHKKKLAAMTGNVPANYTDEYELSEMQRFKIEDAIPPYREVKHGWLPKIQTKLDSADVPCVGLNFVTEILQLDPTVDPLYVCRLCASLCQPTTLVSHVTGYKHRLNYLKVESPKVYAEIKVLDVKKSELTKILEDQALLLEERNGRGQMVVEQEVARPPRDSYEMERPPFRPPPPPLEPQFTPSPFQIEEVRFMPQGIRMEMLEELSQMNASELVAETDASRLDFVISNFRQALTRYKGLVGMSVNHSSDFPRESANRPRPMPQSSVPYDARQAMPYDARPPPQSESGQGSWRLMANREVRYPSFYDYPRSKYY